MKIPRIGTAAAYLLRPSLWSEIPSKTRGALLPDPRERSAAAARARCGREAISGADIATIIPGFAWRDFGEAHPELLDYAASVVASVPFKMGGAGNMSFIYSLCQALDARSVLETGVALGYSSLAVCASLAERSGGSLVSVDRPYPKAGSDRLVGIVLPPHLRGYWTLIRESDRSGIPKAISKAQPFDICHYDSDKSYFGRMSAYPKLWSALRPGGMLVSDDIQDNIAFFDFADAVGRRCHVLAYSGKYLGFLIKSDPDGQP